MKGKLIVIDGTDSSGKASQAKWLLEKLRKKGVKAELYSFPRYEELFGSLVGKYLAGEFGSLETAPAELPGLLFALDRYHIKNEINEKLKKGITLIMDRYSDSNLAHQTARFEKRTEQDEFMRWIKTVESRLPKPDKKVFLNMPIEATSKLMDGEDRAKDYRQGKTKDIHEEAEDYLKRTRAIYKRLVQNEPNWVQVDCAQYNKDTKTWDIKSIEEIHEEVYHVLKNFFGFAR